MALRRIVLALVIVVLGIAACAEETDSGGVTLDEPIGAPDTGSDFVESSQTSSSVPDPSVIKTASVETEVRGDEISSAAQKVVDIANDPQVGGFLVSSVVDTTDGYGAAHVVVKVPAPAFEDVVSDLASIGELQRQELAGDDLTGASLSTSADLARARRHAASLEARLEDNESEAARIQLQQELTTTRRQITNLRDQARDIDAQTAFSNVDVVLTGIAPPAPAQKPALERSLETAKNISLAIASAALLAAGVLVPIAALLLLLYPLGARLFRRARPRMQT